MINPDPFLDINDNMSVAGGCDFIGAGGAFAAVTGGTL
jgi:hypothetical protein